MKSKNRLIVFCSVFPHNTPPPHLIRIARNFATQYPTIVIDLPSQTYPFSIRQTAVNYYHLVKYFFNNQGLFFWQPSRICPKLHYIVFKFYLKLIQLVYNKKIILYTTSPRHDRLYDYVDADLSVFDCYDNPDNELTTNSSVLKTHDLVCASFPMLHNILKSINKNTHLVSAGIHSHKSITQSTNHSLPKSVVFFGGISHRISYDWLNQAIKKLPGVEFYFIGETYLNKYYADSSDKKCERLWKKIRQQPNVHYWNTFIPPEFAPNILSLFKIGIIPYDVNDSYNYNSHPIKLYDYIASGLTVISSAIPSILIHKNKLPIYFANTADEFISLISKHTAEEKCHSPTIIKNINKALERQSLKSKLKQYNNLFTKYGV